MTVIQTPHDITTRLIIGLEVHVELATRSKMWTAAPNVAHRDYFDAEPNTLCDPVVIGMPGTLPVMNRAAVEMAMKVGLALGCRIAERTNRTVYILTVLSALVLPAALLTGLFGINVAGIPGADYPWAFAVFVALLAALVAGQVWLFRRRGWF